jgi:hypothetical protein
VVISEASKKQKKQKKKASFSYLSAWKLSVHEMPYWVGAGIRRQSRCAFALMATFIML